LSLSAAHLNPKFWAEESGVFWLRATHLQKTKFLSDKLLPIK
jgi:hypothetical protein